MTRSSLLRELLRWLDWARGLADGRDRVVGGPAGVPLVLAVLGRPAGVRAGDVRVERHLQLNLWLLTAPHAVPPAGGSARREPAAAPRLVRERVEALIAPPAVLRLETLAAAPRPAAAPAAAPDASPGSPAPLPAARAGAALALQLVERRRRVEELSVQRRSPVAELPGSVAAAPNGIDPLTGWALPVTTAPAPVLRHAGTAAPAETASAARADAGPAPARAPEDAAVALDIDRLADRVVRQIDRRIVAHRERMGRI